MWRWIIGILIFIAFVVWIEFQSGWMTFFNSWRSLSLKALLIALGLVFVSYILRSVRIFSYFKNEMKGRFRICLRLFLYHNFLNNILPMRSGEIAFPVLMKRWFLVSPGKSIPALLWLRFMDLHFLLVLGSASLFHKYLITPYGIPVLLLGMSVPVVFFYIRGKIESLIGKSEFRFWIIIKKLVNGIPQTLGLFSQIWLLTAINWTVKLSVFSWLLMQFVDILFHQSLFSSLVGEFTSVLPIHGLAGVGTYEGGIIAPLKGFGVDFDSAVKAAVNLHMFLLSAAILSAFIGTLLKIFENSEPNS